MDLHNWIKDNGLTTEGFAKKMKWTYLKAYRVCNGITEPSLADVVAIGRKTSGKVTPDDILAAIVAKKKKQQLRGGL